MNNRNAILRAAAILTAFSAFSCFDSDSTLCDTGITCPVGTRCARYQPVCITDSCGDGELDDGEECDDGNKLSGDDCSASCRFEGCGNGIVDVVLGETCDDGNNTDGDGCSADCRTNERCGNGVVDSELGEVCDDGNNISGDGCSADCLSQEKCGNGYIDLLLGEECEPTIAIPSSLAGVTCNSQCKYVYSGGGYDEEHGHHSLVQNCRLTIKTSFRTKEWQENDYMPTHDDRLGKFPGRIVSNIGNINCTPAEGGICVSDMLDCNEPVFLSVLPDEEYIVDMGSIDWGVPGCSGSQSVSGYIESYHPSWCEVNLSSAEPERLINFSYGGELIDPTVCTLNISIHEGTNDQGLQTHFPARVRSTVGGIDCGTSYGGTCTSTNLSCSTPVTLFLALEDNISEESMSFTETVTSYLSWGGEPNCYPTLDMGLMQQYTGEDYYYIDPLRLISCTVSFSGPGTTKTVYIDYDADPSPFREFCDNSYAACSYERSSACSETLDSLVVTETGTECSWTVSEFSSCMLEGYRDGTLEKTDLCLSADFFARIIEALNPNSSLYNEIFSNSLTGLEIKPLTETSSLEHKVYSVCSETIMSDSFKGCFRY